METYTKLTSAELVASLKCTLLPSECKKTNIFFVVNIETCNRLQDFFQHIFSKMFILVFECYVSLNTKIRTYNQWRNQSVNWGKGGGGVYS